MSPRLTLSLLLLPITAMAFLPTTVLAKDPPRRVKQKDAPPAPAVTDAAGELQAQPAKPVKKTEEEKKKTAEEKKQQKKLTEAARLEKIVLPENPTRKQCEDYIATLRKHVEGRNSFGSNDKEVEKLKAVPVEHIDLVLGEMAGNSNLQFYARYALRNIDVDEQKDAIVSKLDEQPNYILFVVHYGWFDAAKPAILAKLQNEVPSTDLKPAWFQAFVEVAEPKHYPKLHELALQVRNVEHVIPLLESLPRYDLPHTINAIWKGSNNNERDYYQRRKRENIAPFAAAMGNIEALGILIKKLQNSPGYRMRMEYINEDRLNVVRLIDYRGSDTDIANWYEANKDKLVFDAYLKKFVLPEGS